MAVGLSPKDASLPSFPWDHEGSWVSASGEGVCPCALMPMTIMPHGCSLQGQGIAPNGCLAASMSPHGCPQERYGYILHAIWHDLSCHLGVPIARMDAPFCLMGLPMSRHGHALPPEGVIDHVGRMVPSDAHGHLSVGWAHPSWVRGTGLRVMGSPFRETGPAIMGHGCTQAELGCIQMG